MCRWLAYSGPEIHLDTLLIKPEHSLLMQSRFARENYVSGLPDFPDGAFPTNGDGFGIGWYADKPEPGLYRELRPAWSDENFFSLAASIRSGLFMAHLRAAYDGIVQRSNSHPFACGNWMMQHNGEVVGFQAMRRELLLELSPEAFARIRGTTDTEVCFQLALDYGLREEPVRALERMAGRIERAREDYRIDGPFRLTCALCDGEALYAVRYSSDRRSKTLYINEGSAALQRLIGRGDELPASGHVVLSEPLDDCARDWALIDESGFVTVRDGNVAVSDFSPVN